MIDEGDTSAAVKEHIRSGDEEVMEISVLPWTLIIHQQLLRS